jgi:hypothetical protein
MPFLLPAFVALVCDGLILYLRHTEQPIYGFHPPGLTTDAEQDDHDDAKCKSMEVCCLVIVT